MCVGKKFCVLEKFHVCWKLLMCVGQNLCVLDICVGFSYVCCTNYACWKKLCVLEIAFVCWKKLFYVCGKYVC